MDFAFSLLFKTGIRMRTKRTPRKQDGSISMVMCSDSLPIPSKCWHYLSCKDLGKLAGNFMC